MSLFTDLRERLRRKSSYLRPSYFWGGWEGISALPFGELVFRNIVEMLTDLNNDVTWVNNGNGNLTFAEFVRFFDDEGEAALWRVYRYGFAVVGVQWIEEKDDEGNIVRRYVNRLRLLDRDEWVEQQTANDTFIVAKNPDFKVYIIKSQSYRSDAKSDWVLCHPAIEFLDNTLNASNTTVKKMGAVVVASPDNGSMAPTAANLNPDDKKEMEETISKEYGLLSRQRQIMLLPRGMRFDTINLCGIDTKMTERVKLNVELIADRIKVPASQIAVIDATAGKSLSNGGEVHEGDRLKYKTYERLLNKTFVAFAEDLGLKVTYSIYNKPADAVTGQINTIG